MQGMHVSLGAPGVRDDHTHLGAAAVAAGSRVCTPEYMHLCVIPRSIVRVLKGQFTYRTALRTVGKVLYHSRPDLVTSLLGAPSVVSCECVRAYAVRKLHTV